MLLIFLVISTLPQAATTSARAKSWRYHRCCFENSLVDRVDLGENAAQARECEYYQDLDGEQSCIVNVKLLRLVSFITDGYPVFASQDHPSSLIRELYASA